MLRPAIRNLLLWFDLLGLILVLQLTNRSSATVPVLFFIIKFGHHIKISVLYTKYSFRIAIVLILLVVVMITVSIVWSTPGTGGLMMPPILFMLFAGCITGSYFAIKSFKEKMDYRKLIGIIINFGMVSLVIGLLFSKIIEIW